MGPHSVRTAAALVALLAALAAAGPAPSGRPAKHARSEILVGFEPGVSAAAQREVLQRLGAAPGKRIGRIRAFVASVPAGERAPVITALKRDPRVRYAEPNVTFRIDVLPNDPSFLQLWGLENGGQSVNGVAGSADADIDAGAAWDVTTGSASVTVGVIDTGVDYLHPDLAANIWINPGEDCPGCRNDGVDNDGNGYVDDWHGWDFKNNDNDPFDDNGHGTHVAGTIGAIGNNGQGVAGVNWTVKIVPLKFLGADGTGDASDAVEAVLYATSMGVVVTNNSWGGSEYSQALADAVAIADAGGSLYVAAAGNSFANTDTSPNYPSGYSAPNIISVAATEQSDARAWFSNYGLRSVDLGAPGTNILSTKPGASYQYLDGTSMATPFVTGAAALAKSAFPSASAAGIKALLLRTVDANTSLAGKTTTGGRLNVGNALACSAPQVWLEEPRPGFGVDLGQTVPIRVLAGKCGNPAGVAVAATGNGAPIPLTARGDGLFTGSYTVTESGGITIQATATAGALTDVQTAAGSATKVYSIVPDGAPVTLTTVAANENARLFFDGVVGRRISLKLTGVTIGTSASASSKISIVNPNGTTLVAPTNFGTSGGFVDTKTLPATGQYKILVDPQGTATGSATLTLYDVPPDATASISPGGADVTVGTAVPGQNARVTFAGVAGRRISLKLTGVTIGTSASSSAKVSILNPSGTALVSPTFFGRNGGFVDVKTLTSTGTYTIVVDPQSNAVGSATLTLYDVPADPVVSIVPGGSSASVATSVPGQNARFTFSGVAGGRISVRLTNVTIGTSGSSSAKVSVLNPNGTTLVAAAFFGTNGGFVDAKNLPTTGTYKVVIDPQSNAVGGVTATLYDVPPDDMATLAINGPAATLSMTVPGQNGKATFTGAAGQRVTLRLTNVTIGTSGSSSAKVSVTNPSGTNLLAPTFFGTSGKTVALTLPTAGTYTVVIDLQSANLGAATVALTSP
jgi:subtilisin family serine protease